MVGLKRSQLLWQVLAGILTKSHLFYWVFTAQ